MRDWDWLFNNVCETLHSFDNEDDVTEFVIKKIESVLATSHENQDVEGKFLYRCRNERCLMIKQLKLTKTANKFHYFLNYDREIRRTIIIFIAK